jgi:hypothetical protein
LFQHPFPSQHCPSPEWTLKQVQGDDLPGLRVTLARAFTINL